MRERFYYVIIFLFLIIGSLQAQGPAIQKVEPLTSFPQTRIAITGSGFSSSPSQLQVWFDHVRGNIITSTEFSIEVEVPAQARLNNVTVLNLVSRLSAQSKLKFMPSFSGEGFEPTKLVASSFSSTKAVFDISTVDIDGDNKPDLIGTTDNLAGSANANTLLLLLNQSTVGNISFGTPNVASLNVGAPTGFVAAGDLNGDGKPDIVTSRSGTTANSIFVLGNTSTIGNPNFATKLELFLNSTATPSPLAREVAIRDLNGDGKPEIIVANSNSTTNDLYIFKNESSGGTLIINPTSIKIPVSLGSETLALEVQDMDGDRKEDIIATKNSSNDIFIFKNTSTLSSFNFTLNKITLPGNYFNDIATADLNRDGKLDIIGIRLFSTTEQVQVLLNKSTTTSFAFAPPIALTSDAGPFGIDVSDLNGDKFPDFIIACRGINTLNAFLHNGNLSSPGFTKVTIATNKTNWFVRAGDLDGDAKPDIAFTSFTSTSGPYSVDVLRNRNCHKPKILNTPPLTICASQNIKLNTIPIPGVTFNWSNGFISIKNGPDPFADISSAATYTVTAVGEGTSCAVVSAPLIVTSGAGSAVADPVITTVTPICTGTGIDLVGSPTISGAIYNWTGPNNFTSIIQNPPSIPATIDNAGIYSLTIKVGDCSSNPVTKRVDVVSFGSFAISSSPSNTVCQGQPVTLSVNSESGYTFQWIRDGINISGQTSTNLTVTQEGSYKVKVTNTALGCSQETTAVAVTIFAAPITSFTLPATGCVGNTITFTNTSVPDPRVTSVDYLWDFGDNSGSTVSKDATHIYTVAQTFSPKLTVSYSGVTGCIGVVTKSIKIGTTISPVVVATKPELCVDGSETSTLTVTGTFNSFLWSTNAVTSSIEVNTPGNYSVATVDANGCKGTASSTIIEKANCTSVDTEIPPLFTPNGDNQNDYWVIPGIENKSDCTMSIFDGRGRRVFQKKGYPVGGWDGVSDEGKEVPAGTYFFVLSCPNDPSKTGSVLIVR